MGYIRLLWVTELAKWFYVYFVNIFEYCRVLPVLFAPPLKLAITVADGVKGLICWEG